MTAKYLLPCVCGQQTTVEPRQAGETVPCSCGKPLQIPTLREMTALEPAPPESIPERPRSTWGMKHGLRLIGIMLVLAALAGGAWLCMKRPVSQFDTLDPETIQQTYRQFSPLQTWDYWEYMKKGLDRRMDQQYLRDVAVHRVGQIAVGVTALLGIALIVASTIRLGK